MADEVIAAAPNEPVHDARWIGLGAVMRVFVGWSLRHEATRWRPALVMVLPLLVAGVLAATTWFTWRWPQPVTGRVAMLQLIWVAAVAVGLGGAQYASKAVCWELSREMRDIVRLTSLDAQTLLWTKTLTRWGTICWSLLLLLPLALLAFTLGGVARDQLVAGAFGLMLVAALVGSMAMLAGVLTCNAQNPEKMAANVTGTILVIYNMAFVAVSQLIYWGWWWTTGDTTPVELFCRQLALYSPSVSVSQALTSPGLFSPLEVGYWLHFVTAAACAGVASRGMHFQWRADFSGERLVDDEPDKAQAVGRRRRFWARYFTLNRVRTAGAVGLDDRTLPTEVERTSRRLFVSSDESAMGADAEEPGGLRRPAQTRVVAARSTGRPRCSDRPFFWKDVYILSEERKRVNWASLFYVVAAIGMAAFLAVIAHVQDFGGAAIFFSIMSIIVASLVISVRFDSLLTVEFRDRTWGSLMLLPVDPCDLLFTKLWAALWEQRFVVLPVGVAQVTLLLAMPTGAYVAGIAVVFAPLAACLMCQMSAVNQLLGKKWWVGIVQVVAFIAVLVGSGVIFATCGVEVGFALTTVLFTVILFATQFWLVHPLARSWSEP